MNTPRISIVEGRHKWGYKYPLETAKFAKKEHRMISMERTDTAIFARTDSYSTSAASNNRTGEVAVQGLSVGLRPNLSPDRLGNPPQRLQERILKADKKHRLSVQ
jgi:hypothetical protein